MSYTNDKKRDSDTFYKMSGHQSQDINVIDLQVLSKLIVFHHKVTRNRQDTDVHRTGNRIYTQ